MDDDTKDHATFLILSQMIFVCTSRRRLVTHSGDEVKRRVKDLAIHSDVSCETMEVDQDPFPCLVKSGPEIVPWRWCAGESKNRLFSFGGYTNRN